MDDEVIETDRLILRPHRPEDIEGYAPLWTAPPEGRSFTPVLDGEAAWARLLRLIGHRHVFGFAPMLVEDSASGRIVGEVGFARFRRDIGPAFDAAPEAMWIVAREVRGRGYGREALVAAVARFDARFPGTRSVCMIEPANTVSMRLAAHLGFTGFGRTVRHGAELVLHQRFGPPLPGATPG